MIKQITEKLTKCPSYMRQSSKRLAHRFKCSERTINKIKSDLKEVRNNYENALKN